MGVTTAITIDYHFIEDFKISHWVRSVMFTFFPFLIGIFVAGLYVTLYIADKNQINESAAMYAQFAVIVLTIIYALSAKFVMFLHEGQKKC